MDKQRHKSSQWKRRKGRVRKKIFGDAQRPRLTIFRSLRHMYAQIIDDESGFTLAAASSLSSDFENKFKNAGNVSAATEVGKNLAHKAMSMGIRQVCFDRCGYKYHGRVRAVAEAARKEGLVF